MSNMIYLSRNGTSNLQSVSVEKQKKEMNKVDTRVFARG